MQNKKWAARVRSELLHPVLGMKPLEVTDIPGLLLKTWLSHFWPEKLCSRENFGKLSCSFAADGSHISIDRGRIEWWTSLKKRNSKPGCPPSNSLYSNTKLAPCPTLRRKSPRLGHGPYPYRLYITDAEKRSSMHQQFINYHNEELSAKINGCPLHCLIPCLACRIY